MSTLADTGLGPGLGGVVPTGGGLVGASGRTSGALGAGGGIEGNLEASPSSSIGSLADEERVGSGNCVEEILSTQSSSSGLMRGNISSRFGT